MAAARRSAGGNDLSASLSRIWADFLDRNPGHEVKLPFDRWAMLLSVGKSRSENWISGDVAAVSDSACPNYDPVAEGQPAAPPLAVRKGCAFPWRDLTHQPNLRRRKAMPSGEADSGKSVGVGPEGQSPSAQQRAKPG